MRIKKIKNTSDNVLTIQHSNGASTSLPAGAEMENIDATNINELRESACITEDLGEINVSNNKQRLFD